MALTTAGVSGSTIVLTLLICSSYLRASSACTPRASTSTMILSQRDFSSVLSSRPSVSLRKSLAFLASFARSWRVSNDLGICFSYEFVFQFDQHQPPFHVRVV